MLYERIYELDDGTEMILVATKIIDDIRYLLLNEKNTDNVFIAYEKDSELILITEDDAMYKELLSLLSIQIETTI